MRMVRGEAAAQDSELGVLARGAEGGCGSDALRVDVGGDSGGGDRTRGSYNTLASLYSLAGLAGEGAMEGRGQGGQRGESDEVGAFGSDEVGVGGKDITEANSGLGFSRAGSHARQPPMSRGDAVGKMPDDARNNYACGVDAEWGAGEGGSDACGEGCGECGRGEQQQQQQGPQSRRVQQQAIQVSGLVACLSLAEPLSSSALPVFRVQGSGFRVLCWPSLPCERDARTDAGVGCSSFKCEREASRLKDHT